MKSKKSILRASGLIDEGQNYAGKLRMPAVEQRVSCEMQNAVTAQLCIESRGAVGSEIKSTQALFCRYERNNRFRLLSAEAKSHELFYAHLCRRAFDIING